MSNTTLINCGIQLIPICEKESSYKIIDQAIELIKRKPHKSIVTPFETAVEASFEEVQQLINEINEFCNTKEIEFVMNLRLHCSAKEDILMNEKTEKFN